MKHRARAKAIAVTSASRSDAFLWLSAVFMGLGLTAATFLHSL